MLPNIIIDNFFEDPDKVVEFANSLNFNVIRNNYPGTRTENLNIIQKSFAEEFADRCFFHFPFSVDSYELELSFQKIPYKFDHGVVHTDQHKFTAIVYLSKENNTGTSIYDLNILEENFSGLPDIDNNNPSEEDVQNIIQFNNQFKKTINVSSIYNRIFLFDGNQPHCANGYIGKERLTLVGFFSNIKLKRE